MATWQVAWKRVLEPIVYMILFAGLTVLASHWYGCTPVAKADPAMIDKLIGLHCEKGSYNEVWFARPLP